MLINPAAIVAFLLYLVVGPLTISQQFQTRFKSLGYGVHQKISSVFSLPRGSFEPQDGPAVFEATPVKTNAVHPIEILPSCPVPFGDHIEVPEICPTRCDNHTSLAPALVFVEFPGYQGPFRWRDLFNLRLFYVLATIYTSIWFPLVLVPHVTKLHSQSGSPDEIEQVVDEQPTLLPAKVLTPPQTLNIRTFNPKPHAPLEPIFSPTPPALSAFWLACECPLKLSRPHRN